MKTKTKAEKLSEKQNAKEVLEKLLPPGTTVYTKLNHVSRSGMSRSIECLVPTSEKFTNGTKLDIENITYYVARLLQVTIDQKNGGVKRGGVGMDMGYDLVMNISYALHGLKSQNISKKEEGGPVKPNRLKYKAGYSLEHRWL